MASAPNTGAHRGGWHRAPPPTFRADFEHDSYDVWSEPIAELCYETTDANGSAAYYKHCLQVCRARVCLGRGGAREHTKLLHAAGP